MHWTLDTWLHKNRGLLEERNKFKKEKENLQKKVDELNKSIKEKENKIEKLNEKISNITLKDAMKAWYRRMKK